MASVNTVKLAGIAALLVSMPASAGKVSFATDVAPILAEKCVECHGQKSLMSDLDLRTRDGLLKGGKHGAAVVPGNSAGSSLYRHLTAQAQPQMPFGGQLTEQQIAVFKAWIDSGAEWDSKVALTAPVAPEKKFTDGQRRYWAFQPVVKPSVPKSADAKWAKTPVDAFILDQLEKKSVRPNPISDKITLLRRATLDLTGLPPTPEEVQSFLADDGPDAFAKVVDRLLASPHYGERWGRHWLDLARYADTNGFKTDEVRPNIWRYRDYVIQSFNEDKPYDRFVREQIAGDELYPNDLNAKVAVGFNRHFTDESNQPVIELRRQETLNDITDTVGAVFMAMTYGCAKCHDHKFDPILHKDYYRLQSFFADIREDDDVKLLSGPALEAYQKQYAEWDSKTRDIRNEMHALVAPAEKKRADFYSIRFSAGTRAALSTAPDQRTPLQQLLAIKATPQISYKDQDMVRELKPEQKKRFAELAAELKTFDALKPTAPTAQMIVDNGVAAPPTHVLAGGSWDAPKEEVQPGFLSILDPSDPKIVPPPGMNSTGRRSVLANWLADPKNPLTARVMVNRIWQYHFGTGIVPSSSDFGLMGERPTNPKLLDYLAATFVESGWSIKKMHRLIMLSSVYQQSSQFQAPAAAADPDDKLLWRYTRHRVEGEALRDSMLLAGGLLNPKMGGPGVHPALPAGTTTYRGSWKAEDDPAEANRRSVYIFVKRNLIYPMFDAFDSPNAEETCARRFQTVIPSQSLALMNDKLVLEWSQALAKRVLNDPGLKPEQQVERAFRIALSRPPQPEEEKTVLDFLGRQSALIQAADPAEARTAAFVDFCHTLLNSNEFLYLN